MIIIIIITITDISCLRTFHYMLRSNGNHMVTWEFFLIIQLKVSDMKLKIITRNTDN